MSTKAKIKEYNPEEVRFNPYQHRIQVDHNHAAALAESIKEIGRLIQIPTGREYKANGQTIVELAAGAHRLQAFRILLKEDWPDADRFPVHIQDLTDREMFVLGLAENVERKTLSPIDEARAVQIARDTFELPFSEIAELLGYGAESTAKNKLRLLDLPEKIRNQVHAGIVKESAARVLLSLKKIMTEEELDSFARLRISSNDKTSEIRIKAISRATEKKDVLELWGTYETGMEDPPRAGDRHLWPLIWTFEANPKAPPKLSPTKFLKSSPRWNDLKAIYESDLASIPQEDDPKKAIKELYKIVTQETKLPGTVTTETKQEFLELVAFETGAHLDLIKLLAHFAAPPSCTACPLYTSIDGVHLCGSRTCWNIKKKEWAREKLEELAEELDLAVFDPQRDGSYYETAQWSSYYLSEAERERKNRFETWTAEHLKTRDKFKTDLRLKQIGTTSGTHPITKSPFVALVSVRPELETIATKSETTARKLDKVIEEEHIDYKGIRNEVGNYWQQITGAWIQVELSKKIAQALRPMIPESVAVLIGRAFEENWGLNLQSFEEANLSDDFAPENVPLYYHVIAYNMIDDDIAWTERRKGPGRAFELARELLEPVGIELSDSVLQGAFDFTAPPAEIIDKIHQLHKAGELTNE